MSILAPALFGSNLYIPKMARARLQCQCGNMAWCCSRDIGLEFRISEWHPEWLSNWLPNLLLPDFLTEFLADFLTDFLTDFLNFSHQTICQMTDDMILNSYLNSYIQWLMSIRAWIWSSSYSIQLQCTYSLHYHPDIGGEVWQQVTKCPMITSDTKLN